MYTKMPIIGWGIVLAAFFPLSLQAASVDLNDFFADQTVAVVTDGSSALLSEDPQFSEVVLANDPGLGDPQVIIAAPGFGLIFDYFLQKRPVKMTVCLCFYWMG